MRMNNRLAKRVLSLVLVIVMVLGLVPMQVLASATLQQDSSGYYLINNEDDLFAFATLVNGGEYGANAKLMANIAMTGQSKPWTPIGSSYKNNQIYTGTFDGQGYTISNMYFNDSTATGGLVGFMRGGTVKNVTIADSCFVTDSISGAIVGNCYTNGSVYGCANDNTTVNGSMSGGIVGWLQNSIIYACWNTGSIEGIPDGEAGGICGYVENKSTIIGCWNSGAITSLTGSSGGIVGYVGDLGTTVSYCYNDGCVIGGGNWINYEGAIVGQCGSVNKNPSINNCYYTRPSGETIQAFGREGDDCFSNVTYVSDTMLPTGGAAYFLNQGLTDKEYKFYQNIDNNNSKDAYPVLNSTHGTVYRGYKACSNSYSYSNSTLPTRIYHSSVDYEVDNLTVKEVCTNANCTVSGGLGSITLQAKDVYYTGNPIANPVIGSFINGGTYKVTYNDSQTVPSAVGDYLVKLNVYDKNSVKCADVDDTFKIGYLPSPGFRVGNIDGYTYYNGNECWYVDGAVARVYAPNEYMISEALNGEYTAFVSFAQDDAKIVYLKRYSDGAITKGLDMSSHLKWDTIAPEGRVELSTGNFWTQLAKKAGFGIFLKEEATVTITAEDIGSGIKSVEYYVIYEDLIDNSELDNAAAIAKLEDYIGSRWETYNEPVSLYFDNKNIVYAKLTDNVDNVTYVSSTGIVLYSDAITTTTDIETTYKAGKDKELFVELNNNTVKNIKCDDVPLTGTDYTVSEDRITLKSEYLDTLVAGDYTITIDVNPLGEVYVDSYTNHKPAQLMVNLTVNPQKVNVPNDDTTSFVYNSVEHIYDIATSDDYTVTGNKQTNAGSYTVTVSLKDKHNTVWTDATTEDKTYEFFIAKADQEAPSGIDKVDETISKKEDGKITGVDFTMEYRTEDESTYTAITGSALENLTSGKYYVRVKGDSNHNPSPDTEVTIEAERKLIVKVPQNQIGYIMTTTTPEVDYFGNIRVEFKVLDGYSIIDDFQIYNKTEPVSFALINDVYTYGLNFVIDDFDFTVKGIADITSPTVQISIKDNKWTSLWNDLTFSLFSKETQDVTITAKDEGSGVKSIQYYLSNKELESDEVKAITDWVDYNNSFKINPDNSYVVYVKVADNDGNVTYTNSEGVVLDGTAPVIEGVENGNTYYTTQKVIVTEKNVDTITLNGNPATESITLEGNKETIYTIVVTDKAGNSTTVTVTMKPIKELTKVTDNLSNNNVTSADASALKGLVEKLDELIADPDTCDESERESLQQHKVIVEALLQTIEDAAKASDTENIQKVKDVTTKNVTPEDKIDLEKAKEDLEKALADNADNYTEDEKKAIEDEIKQMDDALEVISNVEEVEELIHKLLKDITIDDEEAIKAADDAFSALSDYEKSLVDEETKKVLDEARAALEEINKTTDPETPATGDTSNLWLWVALLLVSGIAVLSLTAVGRKRR